MKIMMRESLAGMPRASLSGLLRQSLTMAELDRMFEDDSTESFENLESRLKTPAKKKRPAPTLASEPSQNSEASEDGFEKPLPTLRLDIDPNESSVKTADKIESLNRDFEDCESNKEECEASVVADEEESTPTPSGGTEEAGHMSLYEIEINDEEDFELAENNASLLLQRARSYEDLVTTTGLFFGHANQRNAFFFLLENEYFFFIFMVNLCRVTSKKTSLYSYSRGASCRSSH